LEDHEGFTPLKDIWIYSKSISIIGGTNGSTGSAQLAEFYEFYSQVSQVQVPEPVTITLFGLAGVIMLRKRHRR
jgi:hypothetical protein